MVALYLVLPYFFWGVVLEDLYINGQNNEACRCIGPFMKVLILSVV